MKREDNKTCLKSDGIILLLIKSVRKKQMKNNYCEICGNCDLVLSEIQLKACYGSRHDGESLTLKICGDCIDRIIDYINRIDEKKGNEHE